MATRVMKPLQHPLLSPALSFIPRLCNYNYIYGRVTPTLILRFPHSASYSSLPTLSRTDGKWLSSMKSRIGKCVLWGLKDSEAPEVAALLKDLTMNWRQYVAGANGYLIDKERRGLYRHSVVWGDMDSMAHVNNVVYARWAESARIVWASNFAHYIDPTHAAEWRKLWTPKDVGLILRSIKVDYKFPMEWPDKVSVYHKLNTVGTDSFALDVIILSEKNQRPAAKCHEDIVVYDYRTASKAPLPPWMKAQFDETLRLQKEAMEDSHDHMEELEKAVDNLEKRVLGRAEM